MYVSPTARRHTPCPCRRPCQYSPTKREPSFSDSITRPSGNPLRNSASMRAPSAWCTAHQCKAAATRDPDHRVCEKAHLNQCATPMRLPTLPRALILRAVLEEQMAKAVTLACADQVCTLAHKYNELKRKSHAAVNGATHHFENSQRIAIHPCTARPPVRSPSPH